MEWKSTEKFEHEFYFHQDSNIHLVGRHTMRKHSHTHFEIYYITKGSCCYFINDLAYHLAPGDIVLIPAGVPHNTEYQNTVYSRMLISCSDYYIPESVKEVLPSLLYLYRNPTVSDEIDSIFQKVKSELQNPDGMSADILRCYVGMLFFLIVRNPNNSSPDPEGRHYIEDALEFMQNNFSTPVTLSAMASRYFVSPEHFSRTFKAKTGFNFSEYLNLLRLQKAESLLKQLNTAPITDIANACGFNDSNYFSLKFKELYGISPKKFQSTNE